MGIYDEKIALLRKKDDRLKGKIKKLEKDILELEALLEKLDSLSNKTQKATDELLGNIDKKHNIIPGNFVSFYKSNVQAIATNNHLLEVQTTTINEKNKIKQKILNFEEQIQSYQQQLIDIEQKIEHYTSLNIS